MPDRTGACLCGPIRYRLSADPLSARVCWCRVCQRIASNGTVNALFPAQALSVSGSPSAHIRPADSGNPVRRRFCPDCGCHLFADSPGYPGLVVVRVGTLDEPSSIVPSRNIWASSAPDWACLDPALERVERQPATAVRPPAAA